jgi:hypothetical protein
VIRSKGRSSPTPCATAVWQLMIGEPLVSSFLHAVGNRTTFQRPFADERLAARFDVLCPASIAMSL